MTAATLERQDASRDASLNGVRIENERLSDKLRVPMGEVVAWATAFPRP
jgi:hypothetical protein